MRFFYADPGLRNDLGHHANSCRLIVNELRSRGIETSVFSFVETDPSLRVEVAAVPLFRVYTYESTDGDPISGWLNFFDSGATATREDLSKIPDIGIDDILYLNSARPIQFMALVSWAIHIAAKRLPQVIVEFGLAPGLDVRLTSKGRELTLRDPPHPSSVLYRFTSRQLSNIDPSRFHMATFDLDSSAAYQALLMHPVATLPQPHRATAPLRSRAGKPHITVAILGHQQYAKGYHLVPEIADRLLHSCDHIGLLVQNGAPDEMSDTQRALCALASKNPRLTIEERVAGPALWSHLLDSSDLILCPYGGTYALGRSALVGDALANGIPVVVPANSAPARLVHEFGDPGTVFDRWEPAAIAEATMKAVDNFDELALRAYAAAQRWRELHGPRQLVDAMLALAGRSPDGLPSITSQTGTQK